MRKNGWYIEVQPYNVLSWKNRSAARHFLYEVSHGRESDRDYARSILGLYVFAVHWPDGAEGGATVKEQTNDLRLLSLEIRHTPMTAMRLPHMQM